MKLDERLQERQARENDICPVREQLYSQCFDELIRQVCIECPERGLLLLRVRDEVRMTIEAYRTLYQGSITFGMRKTLQAEQGCNTLTSQIDELNKERQRLKSLRADCTSEFDAKEKAVAEKKIAEEKVMQAEISFLDHQSQLLEKYISEVSK